MLIMQALQDVFVCRVNAYMLLEISDLQINDFRSPNVF